MRASIILAHPNPESLNHSIAATARDALRGRGWEVSFHDLYAEGFDEGSGRHRQLALFPAERGVPDYAKGFGVQVRLDAMDIRTTAAVISRLDAMVACDGGIMHTAVAVGTPTAGIFGSSQSSVWFPYQSFGPFRPAQIDVPCRPCHRHVCPLGHTRCLNELAPAHVADVLQSIMRVDARIT